MSNRFADPYQLLTDWLQGLYFKNITSQCTSFDEWPRSQRSTRDSVDFCLLRISHRSLEKCVHFHSILRDFQPLLLRRYLAAGLLLPGTTYPRDVYYSSSATYFKAAHSCSLFPDRLLFPEGGSFCSPSTYTFSFFFCWQINWLTEWHYPEDLLVWGSQPDLCMFSLCAGRALNGVNLHLLMKCCAAEFRVTNRDCATCEIVRYLLWFHDSLAYSL